MRRMRFPKRSGLVYPIHKHAVGGATHMGEETGRRNIYTNCEEVKGGKVESESGALE